jgi:hypothetical protein
MIATEYAEKNPTIPEFIHSCIIDIHCTWIPAFAGMTTRL